MVLIHQLSQISLFLCKLFFKGLVISYGAGYFHLVVVLHRHLTLAHHYPHLLLLILYSSTRLHLHSFDESRFEAELLLQGAHFALEEVDLLILGKAFFFGLSHLNLHFIVCFLKGFIGRGFALLNQFETLTLKVLLKLSFYLLDLLLFGDEGVPQHVDL